MALVTNELMIQLGEGRAILDGADATLQLAGSERRGNDTS